MPPVKNEGGNRPDCMKSPPLLAKLDEIAKYNYC